jgi:hypothetical protein
MANETARGLLDEFNNGGWDDIKAYFGDDLNTFLDYLSKYGLDGEIDYDNIDDEYKNLLLLSNLEKNPTETLKYITDQLIMDVYPMNDGYYLYVKDRTELADLFKKYGRDTSPYDVAKNVLGEEDNWEPFYDTTNDVYNDVIQDLDKSNVNHLAQYILKNIGNQDLNVEDYQADFFDELAETQNREGYFRITENDVMGLISDQDAMNELLDGDLSDLKSELYSIHNNAYNGAYESEIYNLVYNELKEYFDPQSWEYQTKETHSGKKVTYEYIKINDFYQDIYDFLSNNKTPQWREQYLGYNESYCGFIGGMMDDGEKEWLSFSIPDYADWTDVKKNINEIFTDYVG